MNPAERARAPFDERLAGALGDPNVRDGLLAFQRSWRGARAEAVAELPERTGSDFDELRAAFASVKRDVRANLLEYIEEFTERATHAGAKVVSPLSAQEAAQYVVDICSAKESRVVVKGKSMVTEEIYLNDTLEDAGINAVETDLGEWLIQLAGDTPSHLVMPAIHMRRGQIAELLTKTLGRPFDPDDIEAMVHSARTELRPLYVQATVGVTGANAIVAESGTIMVVSNEGNNRMVMGLPPVHVAMVGIEKLVPTMDDAMAQVRLLSPSATGQRITTYTNFLTGPREDGELHVVLVDNGRTEMAARPEFEEALSCIRCGACANVCPPFQVVAGHGFGHIYAGAIGLVVTPFLHDLEAARGPQSLCVSCGACTTVCPVAIPLADTILEVRRDVEAVNPTSRIRALALRAFRSRLLVAVGLKAAAIGALPFRRGSVTKLPGLRRYTEWRHAPAIPLRPARSRLPVEPSQVQIRTDASGSEVGLLLQCVSDRLAPGIAVSTAKVLDAVGLAVTVPKQQHCCGLPAYDAGDWESARVMAKQTIETFEGFDTVVTPAPSCVAMVQHDYPRIFADDSEWRERGEALAGRITDVLGTLEQVARVPDGAFDGGDSAPVAVHRFCQSTTVLNRGDGLERLLERVAGSEIASLEETDVCCGFGGSTSLVSPEVSRHILDRKLGCITDTRAECLVLDNPGCVLHVRGGVSARGIDVEVLHVAEYLERRLHKKELS